MSPENTEKIAELVAQKLVDKGFISCSLTKDEMLEVKSFITAKKKAAKYGVILVGFVVLWGFKAIGAFVVAHLGFMWR